MGDITRLFREDGAIAGALDGYKVRPQQVEMVRAVEEAIHLGRHLIAEAGTGVGKSLAYLAPFIDWAVREDRRVVVSTYTKALQNQLFVKDLPFLSGVMDNGFRYSLCMGSENYLCLRKARKGVTPGLFTSKKRKEQLTSISEWIERTESGLVTDMDLVPDRSVWQHFCRESDMCLGKKCPHSHRCFYLEARKKQAASHILVTNHSLLFTELVSESRILPEFHGLILDEAHTLEDVATGHLGREAGNVGLRHILDGISELVSARNLKEEDPGRIKEAVDEVKREARQLKKSSEKFFAEASGIFGEEEGVAGFSRDSFFHGDLGKPLAALALALLDLSRVLKGPETAESAKAHMKRCNNFAEAAEFIFEHESDEYVYWAEISRWRKKANYSFHAAPVDISRLMREFLFDNICPVVLTSATLSSGKGSGFSFVKERLGIDDPLELALDSPFDYRNNALLYLPQTDIDPNSDPAGFRDHVKNNILEIYDIMGGRIFALFTSYRMLNDVADDILSERGDINILKQGDLPRYVLLDVFKRSRDSMLMGTTTFWQGVDVPGSSLECVIITKLPFSVPSDPINAARIKAVREKGEDPFIFYQLPRAIIMFKQGFGRLIRSHSDRGVVAVLDPRVSTRRYGPAFLDALPKCRRTGKAEDVSTFFETTYTEDE